MFYETRPNPQATQFSTVRLRDNRIVYGPLHRKDLVDHRTTVMNARDAGRLALADAAGRKLFVLAVADPKRNTDVLQWAYDAQANTHTAQLDTGWAATVAQPGQDGMFELCLLYRGRTVGAPVLCLSAEEAKGRALSLYAARGV